jgi:hypothetical protein
MKRKDLFLCVDPRSSQWQLGSLPPSAGRVMLLGWTRPTADEDEVPEVVRGALAAALVSVGRLVFPSTQSATVEPLLRAGDTVIDLERTITGRLNALLTRRPPTVSVVYTSSSGGARTLFDDPGFPWWLQGQVALLTRHDEPLILDEHTLEALISDQWAQMTHKLEPQGVVGSIRPGVDGAVVAVLSLSEQTEQAIRTAIYDEVSRTEVSCVELSELEFMDRISTSPGAIKF